VHQEGGPAAGLTSPADGGLITHEKLPPLAPLCMESGHACDYLGMSTWSAQAEAFWKDVADWDSVWMLRDGTGYPAPENGEGVRAMPFWSRESRVPRIIETVPAYSGMEPVEVTLQDFRSAWLPGLERDRMRIGLNWAGKRATGFDFEPVNVMERLDAQAPPVKARRKLFPRRTGS
jgi:hypothetical protein